MERVAFDVIGTPMQKGSTVRMHGKMFPAGTNASRQRMRDWVSEARITAMEAMDGREPFTGPIRLWLDFRMPTPTSTIRKWQWGWLAHTKRPDLDKLIRMIGDALTGIVWRDDSQVAWLMCNKQYAFGDEPGVFVDVAEADDEYCKTLAAQRRKVAESESLLFP